MKLYQYPPAFGLPCPSPFCTKAEVLLKMAGVEYEDVRVNDPRKGPKGKLPAIVVDGQSIGDSELIRYELEKRTGFDFDAGLTEEQKSVSHALARMIEERLYWAIVHSRWLDDESFSVIKQSFFASMPPVVRNIIPIVARRQVRGYLHGQGLGRHTTAEAMAFGVKDINALAIFLGEKPWMMGEDVTSLDATAWSHVANAVTPTHEKSPLKQAVLAHENLTAYVARGFEKWFPELQTA
jgi:glutathione S-transferase